MKKLLYVLLAAAAVMNAASCDKSSAGLTSVTYYPVITLEGASYMVVEKGATFTDPGYSATLNGKDVTSDVIVKSNVDTSVSGVYSVTYTAQNEDGFFSTVTRTVVVLNISDPVEGFYVTDPSCNRNGTPYGAEYEILIIGTADGNYMVDDILAGWYCQRNGYGSNYAMEATISIADNGTAKLIDSYIPGWGDGLDSLEGTYDFEKSTFTYTAVYAGSYNFNVKLIKEQ